MSPRKVVSAAALAILLSAGAASAQTTSTTTPGTPNTGVGGSAGANTLVLASSAAVALLGAAYMLRRKEA